MVGFFVLYLYQSKTNKNIMDYKAIAKKIDEITQTVNDLEVYNKNETVWVGTNFDGHNHSYYADLLDTSGNITSTLNFIIKKDESIEIINEAGQVDPNIFDALSNFEFNPNSI